MSEWTRRGPVDGGSNGQFSAPANIVGNSLFKRVLRVSNKGKRRNGLVDNRIGINCCRHHLEEKLTELEADLLDHCCCGITLSSGGGSNNPTSCSKFFNYHPPQEGSQGNQLSLSYFILSVCLTLSSSSVLNSLDLPVNSMI